MSGNSVENLKAIAKAKLPDAGINWETFEGYKPQEDAMVEGLRISIEKIPKLEKLYTELVDNPSTDWNNDGKTNLIKETVSLKDVDWIRQDLVLGYQSEWLLEVYNRIKEVTK